MSDSQTSGPQDELTADEIQEALKIAGELIDAGIPVFAAAPDSSKPGEYHLPKAWEQTRACLEDGSPNHTALTQWRPGWALATVGGHTADILDEDPRNGGRESMKELTLQGHMPRSFGMARTPSGGTHHLISATGERKATAFMPGLDLQSGAASPDEYGKYGRGFAYISPTVRPSKAPETLGELHPYHWVVRPDMEQLAEWSGSDDSTEGVIARVYSSRSTSRSKSSVSADPYTGAEAALMGAGPRLYSLTEAQDHCRPHLIHLQKAPIGEIEDRCNDAAIVLYHFVPTIWSVDEAMALLRASLAFTAYDESHPASRWTVEKFRPVLNGTRPPADRWKVTEREERETPADIPEPVEDEVDALLAQMLDRDALDALPPVRPLIKGVLDMDSESWVIGASEHFKSFVALDWAAHVALGINWRGHRVRQGSVVYVVAEGKKGILGRVKAWETTYGRRIENVRFLPRPVQAGTKHGVSKGWAVLIAACTRLKPSLIVLDTQARVTVGLNENDNSEMSVFVSAVTALKDATDACVLVVHHIGRGGGDARGASALDGAQDVEIRVERPVDKKGRITAEGRHSLTATVSLDKNKDGSATARWPIRMTTVPVGVDPDDGQEIRSLAVEPLMSPDQYQAAVVGAPTPEERADWRVNATANQLEVMEVILEHGDSDGATEADIVRWIKEHRALTDRPEMPRGSVRSALRDLKVKCLVAKDGARYVASEHMD